MTQHIRLIITALICLVLGVSVVTAQDDDAFEFPLLENGDNITATFETGHDSQLYAFFGSAGDRVTIFMAQTPADSPLDPLLILLAADGAVVAVDDDGGDNPYFSALIRDAVLPEDGLYLILATHKEGTRKALDTVIGEAALADTLTYTLTLNGVTPPVGLDSDEIALTATEMARGERALFDLSLENAVAFAIIEGRDGQRITLETDDPGDGVDTILLLFDAEGRRVAINDDGEGIGVLSRITYDIEADGLYLVMVTAYQYDRTVDDAFNWNEEGVTALSVD